MARAKKSAVPAPEAEVPAEINWAYGIRTWAADGKSYGGFQWDLTPEARTTAPDWSPIQECGNGLHCNPYGMGDWSLLGNLNDVAAGKLVLGIVRYDAALAVDLNGKIKAPWMEVVITTLTAGMGSVLGYLAKPRHNLVFSGAKATDEAAATTGDGSAAATTGDGSAAATTGYRSAAATTGDGSAAATTGYRSAAATTGDRSAAATTGDRSAAATTGDGSAAATTGDRSAAATTGDGSAAATTGYRSAAATTGDGSAAATTGKHSIAAALGPNSTAKASEGGAIMLAAYGKWDGAVYPLQAVFAGMVGQTYDGVTIEPGVAYELSADGSLRVATC